MSFFTFVTPPPFRRRTAVFMLLCLLLLCLFMPSALAAASEVAVTSAADITAALSGAASGDTITFLFAQNVTLDSSLDSGSHIVIPQGVTAIFRNAPGKYVTVIRQYAEGISALPYSPMVTVDGTLIIEEDVEGGGSLTFSGGDRYFKNQPMFSVNGEMTVNSSTFTESRSYSGGVIYAAKESTVTINGGMFTGCTAQDNGYGGVICAYGNLTIAGGTFTGNDACMGGVVYYSGNDDTLFTMTGGSMENNGENCVWGGAISVVKGSAHIIGGSFIGNTSSAFGGAIYVDMGARVSMARVLIYGNHGFLQGGGIFNCATGGGDYRRFCGMTLYQNTCSGDPQGNSGGDDFFSYKKNNAAQLVYVSDYTLNGAKRPWYKDDSDRRYQAGDLPADSSYYQDSAERFALKSGSTRDDFTASNALAWVTLSGNSSASGGAIANNGELYIGYDTKLTLEKIVKGVATDTLFTFEIILTDADGFPYTDEIFYELNSAEHSLSFDDSGKATLQLGGGQQAILLNIPMGFHYQIREQNTAGYTLIESVGANGEMTNEEATAVFTNERVLPTTDFSVTKRWEGDDLGAIQLTLYANGTALSPQPAYVRNGNTYTYSALPKYDSADREIVYSAKERYFDGYMTIYDNIAPRQGETSRVYNGGTIINRAVTSISVQKVWSGLDGDAPAITLTLYRNGEVYNRAQPTPNSDGVYTYSNLPPTLNGVPVVYSVVETPMSGFVTSYENTAPHAGDTDRAYNGGIITNRKIPKTGDDDFLPFYWVMAGVSLVMLVLLSMDAIRKRKRS